MRNAWTWAHRSEDRALNTGWSVTGAVPTNALLCEIREQPSYQPLNQGAKLFVYT
jgi:hypothetical protein